MTYKFNHTDWFSHNIPNWKKLKDLLPGNTKFLEIGSFEGRSTVWIAENFASDNLDVVIDCIDTWEGGEEHSQLDMDKVYTVFSYNKNVIEQEHPNLAVLPWKGLSHEKLIELTNEIGEFNYYDFIYIDGSHQAPDVLTDACLAWPLLKQGGIMVFDDYHWHPDGFKPEQTPQPAIDAFLTCFYGKYKSVFSGYQIAVQKL